MRRFHRPPPKCWSKYTTPATSTFFLSKQFDSSCFSPLFVTNRIYKQIEFETKNNDLQKATKQQLFCITLFDLYSNVCTYFRAPIKMSYKVINFDCNVFGREDFFLTHSDFHFRLRINGINAIFARQVDWLNGAVRTNRAQNKKE